LQFFRLLRPADQAAGGAGGHGEDSPSRLDGWKKEVKPEQTSFLKLIATLKLSILWRYVSN
jgi:hypothetical protein